MLASVPDASKKKVPLVLGFHGQGYAPETWGPADAFTELAKENGWVLAFPAGLREATTDGGSDVTWNVGTAADNSTCVPDTNGVQCMESCHSLRSCGACNWATCHDDGAFVDQVVKDLEAALCIDTKRIFLVGESNGGMLVHYLIQRFPGRFRAAVPTFALPLIGYLVGPQYELLQQRALASHTSILQLHDRGDVTIPWTGGKSQVCIHSSFNP